MKKARTLHKKKVNSELNFNYYSSEEKKRKRKTNNKLVLLCNRIKQRAHAQETRWRRIYSKNGEGKRII